MDVLALPRLRSIFGPDWEWKAIPAVNTSGGIALLWPKDRVHVHTTWTDRRVLYGVISTPPGLLLLSMPITMSQSARIFGINSHRLLI